MLFLGIDQHARQLTVSLRDQQGDVLLARKSLRYPPHSEFTSNHACRRRFLYSSHSNDLRNLELGQVQEVMEPDRTEAFASLARR